MTDVAMPVGLGLGLLCACVLAMPSTLHSQDVHQDLPPFLVDEDPQGHVWNEDGQPVCGARIEVICVGSPSGYLRALTEAVSRVPLLPAFSGSDGRYVLPLTALHRQVWGGGPGVFLLQVTHPRYETWREMLSGGLGVYMGSEVKLRALASLPELTLRVEHPKPGMLLAVQNSAYGDGSRLIHLSDAGTTVLPLAMLPHPPIIRIDDVIRPWSFAAQILYPGSSTLWSPIELTGNVLSWRAGVAAGPGALHLRDVRGRPPDSVWGIYETADGQRVRFDFAGSALPFDAMLTLRYAGAGGMSCAEVDGAESLMLMALPEQQHALRIQIRSDGTTPLPGCVGILWALEESFRSDGSRLRRPLATLEADAGGVLVIPRALLETPAELEVRALDHLPSTIFEPRRLHGDSMISLEPIESGELSFDVQSEDGEPIEDALLFLSDRAYAAAGIPGGLLRSDARGHLTLGSLPPGIYRYRCVATGRIPVVGRIEVGAKGDVAVEITMVPAVSMRLRTLDSMGRPLPFSLISLRQHAPTGVRSLGSYRSDSLGRLLLHGLLEESQLGLHQRVMAGQDVMLYFDVDAEREAWATVERVRPVLVRLPPGAAINRLSTNFGNGTSQLDLSGLNLSSVNAIVLFAWAGSMESQAMLGIAGAPPVRILGSQVAEGDGAGVFILDRRRIVRRQPFKFLGMEGADLRLLRVEPIGARHAGKIINHQYGQMVEVDDEGIAWYIARDRGPYRCMILHPEYLLRITTVVSQDADTEPIVVRLVKGTPLTVIGKVPAEATSDLRFNLSLRSKNARYGFQVVDLWGGAVGKQPGDALRISCPVALLPGEYDIDLHLGTHKLSRSMFVLPEFPATVEFTGR